MGTFCRGDVLYVRPFIFTLHGTRGPEGAASALDDVNLEVTSGTFSASFFTLHGTSGPEGAASTLGDVILAVSLGVGSASTTSSCSGLKDRVFKEQFFTS
jgi:hypothetical protein